MNNSVFRNNYSCSNNKDEGCSCLTCNLSAGTDSQGISTGAGTFPGETNNPRIQSLQGDINNNIIYNIKENMTDKRNWENRTYPSTSNNWNNTNKQYDVVIQDDDNTIQSLFPADQQNYKYSPMTGDTQVSPADPISQSALGTDKRDLNSYTCVFPKVNDPLGITCLVKDCSRYFSKGITFPSLIFLTAVNCSNCFVVFPA